MTTGRITQSPKIARTPHSKQVRLEQTPYQARTKNQNRGALSTLSSPTAPQPVQFLPQPPYSDNHYGSGSIPASQQNMEMASACSEDWEKFFNLPPPEPPPLEFSSAQHHSSSDIEESIKRVALLSNEDILSQAPTHMNITQEHLNKLNLQDPYKFLYELGNGTPDLSIPETQSMPPVPLKKKILKQRNTEKLKENLKENLKEKFKKMNEGNEKEKEIKLVGKFYQEYSEIYSSAIIAKLLEKDRQYISNLCYIYEHSIDPTPNKWNINSLLKHAENNVNFFKKNSRNYYSEEAKNAINTYLKSTMEDPEIKCYDLYSFIELHTKIPFRTIKNWHQH